MFATITDLWPPIGFNTVWGLLLLYMGGALGVNTWLMKGFFDTIPKDLDESAKVDGASHAQIFFGIILPLVAPILAVTGLLGFIGAVNEFLIASIFLTQDSAKTAAVGLYGLVSQERNNNFGGVRRRHPHPRHPDGGAVPVPAALHRRRPDRRRGQGLTTMPSSLLAQPHHDGAALHVANDAPARRDGAGVPARAAGRRVHRGVGADHPGRRAAPAGGHGRPGDGVRDLVAL